MFGAVEIKEVKEELGDLVKILRQQRRRSQEELAQTLDVSRTTIQNLESGKNFTIDTLLKVLKEMNQLEELYQEITDVKKRISASKSLY